tara:strand:- start:982 stop:2556 length:1575 start_codon:yes stop_codon:yes gene_type:complete
MKEFDKLIENTFDQKSNKSGFAFEDLISLVESSLDEVYDKVVLSEREMRPSTDAGAISAKKKTAKEFLLSLPKFSPNESWGDPKSVDRQTVDKIFSVVGGGATLEEKLKFIQQISNPSNKITSPRRIISTLIILESLASVVNSFSSSAAGFVFEGFLAALLKGRQEAERSEKGNLPIQDVIGFSEIGGGTPISLKMLRQAGNIKGSYTNLVDALDEFGAVVYLVARKEGDQIALEQFVIDRDNFVDAISSAAASGRTKEKNLFKIPGYGPVNSINYINGLNTWPEKFRALQRTAGYRGDTSREATKNDEYDQKKEAARKEAFEKHWAYEDAVKAGRDHNWFIGNKLHIKLGLDPDDNYPTDPREAWQQDAVYLKGLHNFHGNSYYSHFRRNNITPAQDKKNDLKIWWRRNTADTLEESLLTEARGTQWSISPPQLKSLSSLVNYEFLGELPYSSDKIEKIAEMHMDKLNGSLLEIFESTKALSDNVNNYFTYEERGRAIESGESAIDDAQKIETSLRKEISEKD